MSDEKECWIVPLSERFTVFYAVPKEDVESKEEAIEAAKDSLHFALASEWVEFGLDPDDDEIEEEQVNFDERQPATILL